jgi:hypothetical protein
VGALRGRTSFANVVAILALFVALGGTAVALSKNSVTSRHIAPKAVKRSDIKPGAVNSRRVKDRSLKPKDLSPGVPVARAYAYVDADADVVEARSLGIADANVTDGGNGHYCFYDLPFDPVAVFATGETSNLLAGIPIASARLDPDAGPDLCTGTEDASVSIVDASLANIPTPAARPFWVVFF